MILNFNYKRSYVSQVWIGVFCVDAVVLFDVLKSLKIKIQAQKTYKVHKAAVASVISVSLRAVDKILFR